MDFDHRLLVNYIIGDLPPQELEALMAWRKESEENEGVFNELVRLRIRRKFDHYHTPENIDEAFSKFNKRLTAISRRRLILTVARYAAVVLLAVSIAFFGRNSIKKEETYIVYKVNAGDSVRKIPLDDGSNIWLNSSSTLKVPASFSAEKRRVILEGEAYFEVRKRPAGSFLVSTGQLTIKVLGTSFNVKTAGKNKDVETTLASGKVTLFDKNDKAVYQMSPGEKVTYSPISKEYTIENVDTNVRTAWHLAQFTFENITLREIVNKLSVKFNVNINLESKKLAERRYRCVINNDESLEEVLDILKYLIPIQYRIEENEVFISE
jgi:ferric-dicitrate binding protein FerR (iron transport regulator)